MPQPPQTLAIGILARNEEAGIADLVEDLSGQSLLNDDGDVSVHVHLVANGCTDQTVEVARRSFSASSFRCARAGWTVHELETAGKSNAWNMFVHEMVPMSTDYVLFLDGDIRIPDRDSLKRMVASLTASPNAVVAVDRSVKDIELERPRGIVEKLIKVATGTANDPQTAIAGACYIARYSEIRKIWMPIGLPGEDGFLRAMLLTSNFEREERLERLIFVKDSYHVFESMRDFRGVLSHNVRLAIGTTVNILLFWHFMKLREKKDLDIAEYVRARNESDPGWVNSLIRERLITNYFPLEPRFLSRRLRGVGGHPERQRSVRAWAVALMGTGFDLIVFLKATMLMRKGAGAGYW